MLEQAFVGAQLHLPLDDTYWHGSDASYMALCLEVGHPSVNIKCEPHLIDGAMTTSKVHTHTY